MAVQQRHDLAEDWIELDPARPGPQGARLREYGVPIWILVGYWKGSGQDAAVVARDFDVPIEAVEAALAYYQRHPDVIDARITLNVAAFTA